MKTTIIHDWLFHRRGGEACWEEIRALHPDAALKAFFADARHWPAAWRGLRVETSGLNAFPGSVRLYRWLLPFYPFAARSLAVTGSDLTISISHCAAKNVPVRGGRHLCYCLTPARYLFDLRGEYLTSLPALSRPLADAILDRLAAWDVAGSRGVDRFVAISRTVADRIRALYGRDAAVVYPPVDTELFTPGNGERSDYYLSVTALVPYKRVDLALAACAELGRKLIVVGDGPMAARWLVNRVANVEWVPYAEPERLRALYRGCRALLFPPREDFGIAPVEALACGRPVIAFNAGGASETVRDGETGVLFGAQTVAAVREAIRRFESLTLAAADCRAAALPYGRERFRREFSAQVEQVMANGK